MKFFKNFCIFSTGLGCGLVLIPLVGAIGFFLFSAHKYIENAGFKEEWNDSYGTIFRDISYGEKENNRFDLFIPANADKEDQHGLMLFIHGGGWSSGKRSDVEFACKRYAKAGYITATLTYSLLKKEAPEITLWTMLDEIEACLAQIKVTAAEKGYQIDKAALSGFSAGGHLSLLYSYSRAEQSPLPLKFVFEQVGPVDFHPSTLGWDTSGTAHWVTALTGHSITVEMINKGKAEEIINSISPVAHITKESLPTLCGYGLKDKLVIKKHPIKLETVLKKAGVPYSYVKFPHSGHGLDSDPLCRDRYHREVLRFAKEYFGY